MGRARLAFGQGLSLWVLEAPGGFGDARFHSHHAIQITISLRGTLALSTEEPALAGQVLGVAPDVPHKLSADGLLCLIFVEPESLTGRALSARLFERATLVEVEETELLYRISPLRNALDPPLDQDKMVDIGWAAVELLARRKRHAELPDPRIKQIIDYAAAHFDEPLVHAAASTKVHLSESRLRHLFVEQTGLAFKTYLIWLRLNRAVQLYSQGASLTEAAHSAGFADSAHFSRLFKRNFGLPATTLTRL